MRTPKPKPTDPLPLPSAQPLEEVSFSAKMDQLAHKVVDVALKEESTEMLLDAFKTLSQHQTAMARLNKGKMPEEDGVSFGELRRRVAAAEREGND